MNVAAVLLDEGRAGMTATTLVIAMPIMNSQRSSLPLAFTIEAKPMPEQTQAT